MKHVAIILIQAYQRFISPLLPNSCRFYPTCSQYTLEAIRGHGFIRGTWLGIKRISRCQPFCAGGHDPVPPPRAKTTQSNTADGQQQQAEQQSDLESP